jgi:hypothetical protein
MSRTRLPYSWRICLLFLSPISSSLGDQDDEERSRMLNSLGSVWRRGQVDTCQTIVGVPQSAVETVWPMPVVENHCGV